MTIALEHIQEGDWAALNRAVDQLRSLVLDTGGRSLGIRFGTVTLTWPGGAPNTGNVTVTHGLGRTPSGVWLTASLPPVNVWQWVNGLTATTFSLQAQTTGTPGAGTTVTIAWVAIG